MLIKEVDLELGEDLDLEVSEAQEVEPEDWAFQVKTLQLRKRMQVCLMLFMELLKVEL